MKTFNNLKIEDNIFWIDDRFNIKSAKINGIIKPRLTGEEIIIYIVDRGNITVKANTCVHRQKIETTKEKEQHTYYFSCLEAVQKEREALKERYIAHQYSVALIAFKRIKKVSPKNNTLKLRVFNFFNIKEHPMSKQEQKQYRYKTDGGWDDLPPSDSWEFVYQFLDGYEGRGDTAASVDLSDVLDENPHEYKDLEWLYDHYPEYEGFGINKLKKVLERLENKLFREAKRTFDRAVKSGEIEIREISN